MFLAQLLAAGLLLFAKYSARRGFKNISILDRPVSQFACNPTDRELNHSVRKLGQKLWQILLVILKPASIFLSRSDGTCVLWIASKRHQRVQRSLFSAAKPTGRAKPLCHQDRLQTLPGHLRSGTQLRSRGTRADLAVWVRSRPLLCLMKVTS